MTDDPHIKGPFTKLPSGTIVFPLDWLLRHTPEQKMGAAGHEIGHIKHAKRFFFETCIVSIIVGIFAFILETRLPVVVVIIPEISLLMILFRILLWHNEYRADEESYRMLGHKPILSILCSYLHEHPHDEGSDTHPATSKRIKRIIDLTRANETQAQGTWVKIKSKLRKFFVTCCFYI
ncbi:MAG: M48 family metalloprotease [Conexivisphaerales archaeon]